MAKMTIYGDSRSGNCLKVKWTADHLGLAYDWVECAVMTGVTRTPAFLAVNPSGQVPAIVLPDGRALSQSNAITTFLAEGSPLVPQDRYARARMYEWMYWEQYSHEPYVAVARFQRLFLGKPAEEVEERIMARGHAALARLETGLADSPFLVGDSLSLADIALIAYTRLAHEGGFDLAPYPRVRAWIARAEAVLGLEPVPA